MPSLDDVLDCLRASAEELSIEAYLVGGFVRDRLLERPGKDIDLVAVGQDGVPLLDLVARRMQWGRSHVFERFGTAQVRGDGFIVEIVRARSERYDPESRKPDVEPGTLEEDIWRRDFTINALAQTLSGEVLDITRRGLADLRTGILRTPLDPRETFSEDPLRMFRAARFVARLGFRLADGTLEAMRAEAPRTRILSTERINEELRKLLVSEHVRDGIDLLQDAGLLEIVLPELSSMVGIEQGGYHTYDVYGHTVHAVELSPPDLLTRLATLLHDVGKPPTHVITEDGRHTFYDHPVVGARMAEDILTRLRFSNEEISAVSQLVRLHLRPIQYREAEFSDAAVRRLIRDAGELRTRMLDVARADTRASAYPDTETIDALADRMDRLDDGGRISRLAAPLDGNEIMAIAGRGAGPWVGTVKRGIEEAILEGTMSPGDAEAARAWMRQHPEAWQT